MSAQVKFSEIHKKSTAYLVFLLATAFYLYEFILQVAPSVMAKPMMQTFNVSATGYGMISAFYFYAYAPMQIPAGLLFDRYGPRKLMTLAIMLCATGSIFFASTTSIFTAAAGRFMIGFGSAFSFIGALVLLSRWFPPSHFAILAGIAQFMSSMGAIFGERPLAMLINAVGWRESSFILGGVGFVLAILFWSFIRDYPHQSTQSVPTHRLRDEWKRLRAVCGKKHTWITGAYACSIWTPIAVFSGLWGIPYLEVKFNIGLLAASSMCSMTWLAIGIGSPLFGWLSDKLESRRLILGLSGVLGLVATICILYLPGISKFWMYFILFLFGLGASGQTVSFAVVKDNNDPNLVGTACGFNNLSVVIGAAVFQPLVGVALQHIGYSTVINGISVYGLAAYQKSLIIMPLSYLINFLLVLFVLKESHPTHIKNQGRVRGGNIRD
ncbi:MAG: MFS transporter [Legionella sp.]|nr:MFS transporter [Legionella sp.]